MIDPNDTLHKEYQNAKKSNIPPHAIKQAVLNANRESDQTNLIVNSFKSLITKDWLTAYAACAALVVLTYFYSFYDWSQSVEFPIANNIEVVYHGYPATSSNDNKNTKDYSKLKTHAWKAYQQQQFASMQIHNTSAKLVNNKNGWTLESCEKTLIKISPELINELIRAHRVDPSIKRGETVDLVLNSNGFIVQLNARSNPLVCS